VTALARAFIDFDDLVDQARTQEKFAEARPASQYQRCFAIPSFDPLQQGNGEKKVSGICGLKD
jgi:hypothetical protein